VLTDRKIIQRFKIRPPDKILDVGGSMKQHTELKIDTLVDIIRPEEAPYGKSRLKAKHFVRLDLNKDKFPFGDRQFDFCLCTHTLEDLAYPFVAIAEMERVAKRGLIITPSMGADMVFSHVEMTNWLTGARRVPGKAHHKWFFYKKKKKIRIIPKNYAILYSSKFQITGWRGDEEMIYCWEGSIDYERGDDLNIHKLINEYESYISNQRANIKKGRVLYYIDNPIYYFKELLKLLLKKGKGFKYRKSK
jgi:ubiquinone/menaquinone biosynthesis C-methylase UbiE